MKRPAIFVALLCTALACARGETHACQADVFMPDAYAKRPEVVSPDRSKHLRLWSSPVNADPDTATFHVSIYSGSRLVKTLKLKDLSAGTFIKWAPDSKAFYVMWSDGGAIGSYHVRAFAVSKDEAEELAGPKAVATDFARKHYCKTRGNNLYALRWIDGSQKLLLAPEVYPTSDCGAELGFSSGYLVSTTSGEIVKKYTTKEVLALANGCPSTIYPTALMNQKDVEKMGESDHHE